MSKYEPFYWLNKESIDFLSKGYLIKGQTPNERIRFIADTAENYLNIPGYADKFYDYMSRGWFSLASPVWSNYGTNKGLPISCFGSYPDDNMESILYTQAEVGMLSKLGGGTSGYFGALRPRGASITNNGESSGAVHFLQLMDAVTNVVSQGSTRRGYFAGYLPADHPDILEFLKIGHDGNTIQGIYTGVAISDEFMSRVLNQEDTAVEVWLAIINSRKQVGFPYLVFTGNANNNKPECYSDKPIVASNLCVTGDTRILTREGYKPIQSLSGQTVECWNGTNWSPTPIFQTSEGQEVIEVLLSNGHVIKATPYHKWYVAKQDARGKLIGEVMKRTFELQPDDKLVKYNLEPVTHGAKELPHAYANGFHTADGTVYSNGSPRISLYGNKKDLVDKFTGYNSITEDSSARLNINYKPEVLQSKFFVPSSDYSVQSRLEWLAGLFDGDGTLTNNNGTESIQLVSVNKPFLLELQLLLQELGVDAKISLISEAGYRKLPANDGTGKLKDFWCKESYRIMLAGSYLNHLVSLGLPTSRVVPTTREYNRKATQFVKVVSVTDNNEVAPTYCGTEPEHNRLMFNGVLTGNCSEIMLPSNPDETFVCVLSSMNLLHYDEWKDTDAVEVLTMFLDSVVTEAIDKLNVMQSKTKPEEWFLHRIQRFLENHRALGLGVLGLSSYYQSIGISFDSQKAARLNYEIFKLIREKAENASIELGTRYGCVMGTNRRNTTLLAIAPTKSSSFILGQVSQGIEPLMSNYFINDTAKAKIVYKNKFLEELLESIGKNTSDVWQSILMNDGSVQHLDFLSNDEKAVFKTFAEIDPNFIIEQASIRQEFIDQGQSLNLLIGPSMKPKEIHQLYVKAWKLGIKSLYYQFGISSAQELSRSKLLQNECSACHA